MIASMSGEFLIIVSELLDDPAELFLQFCRYVIAFRSMRHQNPQHKFVEVFSRPACGPLGPART